MLFSESGTKSWEFQLYGYYRTSVYTLTPDIGMGFLSFRPSVRLSIRLTNYGIVSKRFYNSSNFFLSGRAVILLFLNQTP